MTAENIPPRRTRAPGTREDLKTITVPLESITPILGGAAVPRTLDDHDPIRVPGIRGQLRFWWRALYGHDKTASALAREEAEIWGGVHGDEPTRSRVVVWISNVDMGGSKVDPDDIGYSTPGSYALWPARATEDDHNPAPRRAAGVRFDLCIRTPAALEEQVKCALRAWILFGGIGSRTRRGCGSVTVQKQKREEWLPRAPTLAELRRLLGDGILRAESNEPTDMPSLRGAMLLHGNSRPAPVDAWKSAINWLNDFRQGPGPTDEAPSKFARAPIKIKKRPGKSDIKRPGRSHWPEPDKIRHLLARDPNHKWAHPPVYNQQPVWPRASFGLPIAGKFQGKDIDNQRYHPRDPDAFELGWQDGSGLHDRLASPLILKALPLANGTCVPIALWLERAYPRGGKVVLRRKKNVIKGSDAPFDLLRANEDAVLYGPLKEATSMKDAFVSWLMTEKNLARLEDGDA